MDWDVALREENNRITPVGLYDLDRNIRPVGRSYKQLIQDWCHVLPAQSVCLTVPVVRPHDMEESVVRRNQTQLRKMRHKEVREDNQPVAAAQTVRR
jgi:hypothetical protein